MRSKVGHRSFFNSRYRSCSWKHWRQYHTPSRVYFYLSSSNFFLVVVVVVVSPSAFHNRISAILYNWFSPFSRFTQGIWQMHKAQHSILISHIHIRKCIHTHTHTHTPHTLIDRERVTCVDMERSSIVQSSPYCFVAHTLVQTNTTNAKIIAMPRTTVYI